MTKRRRPPKGLRPIGPIAAEIVADLKFQRQVKKLHAMGPRPLAEMLAELAAERNIRTIIEEMLPRYTDIPDEALELAGGDEMPATPLHETLVRSTDDA